VGLIESADPLVLEVKIFDLARNYGREYIRKGLTQAYKYALDYGKPVGYLLIYDMDERDLSFEKSSEEPVKSIHLGAKVLYIVCVKVRDSDKSASQRKASRPGAHSLQSRR